MDDILKDSRFSHITSDVRFRKVPKKEKKVKVDKRFEAMFHDKRFQVKANIDKRGRPMLLQGSENLQRYYDLSENSSSEEGDEEDKGKKVGNEKKDDSAHETEDNKNNIIKSTLLSRKNLAPAIKVKLRDLSIDYARGEGRILTDSSSGEESSEEEEEEDSFEHRWGELDKEAETTEEATPRLALCNMDWDRIKAQDLMVLFNSFLPTGGLLISVTIYPSEFGLKRMEEEDKKGPTELCAINSNDDQVEDEDEMSVEQREKLRQYQLNRLKYYYAVLTFDSANTANHIYAECDGLEYESSMNRLDLRFIPDETTFDQEPKETCEEMPDLSSYKPKLYRTTALTQVKVDLTWDETDPSRADVIRAVHSGKGYDDRLNNFVAVSSSEGEDDDGDEEVKEKQNDIEETSQTQTLKGTLDKYKALLADIEKTEEKKKQGVSMEVSWDLKLEQKVAEKVKETTTVNKDQTPFEKYLEKKKDKRKAKKDQRLQLNGNEENGGDVDAFSDDDIPSDIDMNDPYFREEFGAKKKDKKKKVGRKDAEEPEDEQNKKELELLMLDEAEEESKRHFSLKKIEESEKTSKRKRKFKKGKKEALPADDDFKIDVKDERFGAIFTSHHYNVDPADPQFRSTHGMKELIAEKLRRKSSPEPQNKVPKMDTKKKEDVELNLLVKSVKSKTGNIKKKIGR